MLHTLHTGTQTIMEDKTGHTRELLKASVLTMSSPFPRNHKEKKMKITDQRFRKEKTKGYVFTMKLEFPERSPQKIKTENSIFMKTGMG